MPSTHLALHYHMVFSTKGRQQQIKQDVENQLHPYLGGIIRDLDAIPICIGGTDDHVHVLAGLKANHRLSDFMRDLKSGSSEWMHKEQGNKLFGWQEGYGAFTVSTSNLDRVREYISNQRVHHGRRSFQDEYIKLLRLNGVEFDERHLW
jgi:putative transposase